MQELGVAVHMDEMITEITVDQLKHMITSIGGFVNFQVKFEGKAAKSYLLPQHEIPGKILERWQQRKSSDYGMLEYNYNITVYNIISVTSKAPAPDTCVPDVEESNPDDMSLCEEVRVEKKTPQKSRTRVRKQQMSRNWLHPLTKEQRKKVRARRKRKMIVKRMKMGATVHANIDLEESEKDFDGDGKGVTMVCSVNYLCM
jgi:hypothetical protein